MTDGPVEHSFFTRPAMVRGYHVFNPIWKADIGKEQLCMHEANNVHEHFAVAIVNSATVVGNIP